MTKDHKDILEQIQATNAGINELNLYLKKMEKLFKKINRIRLILERKGYTIFKMDSNCTYYRSMERGVIIEVRNSTGKSTRHIFDPLDPKEE